jgi:TrmH family RNA methyltransferase
MTQPDTPASAIEITSRRNPRIKEVAALNTRRERKRTGMTLIEGTRAIHRATMAGVEFKDIFVCPESDAVRIVPDVLNAQKDTSKFPQVYHVPLDVLRKLAYRESPEGIIATAPLAPLPLQQLPTRDGHTYIICEGIEKPGNIGAILRIADGAGVNGIILTGSCTDLGNPNVIRASTGTIFNIPVSSASPQQIREWADRHEIDLVAAAPETGTRYTDMDLTRRTAFVVGEEHAGLSEHWRDERIRTVNIPMLGIADSLNVSVSVALLSYEALRQRHNLNL